MSESTIFRKLLAIGSMMTINLPLIDEACAAFGLLDQTGVLKHLTGRTFDKRKALAISGENKLSAQELLVRDFFAASDGYYLKSDILGRTGAPRVCRAIASRMKELHPEGGDVYQQALMLEGSQGLFRAITAHADRLDLMAVAGVGRTQQRVSARIEYGREM